MASPRRSDAEWYQNDTHVTASVLIKRLPTREGLRPVFEQRNCAIYIGGKRDVRTHVGDCDVDEKDTTQADDRIIVVVL